MHPDAFSFRRKAATCGKLAACAASRKDRDQLMRMRHSWLALAENREWIDGLPPLPPVNLTALAVVQAR